MNHQGQPGPHKPPSAPDSVCRKRNKLTLKRWSPCWYENMKSASSDWNQRHLDLVKSLGDDCKRTRQNKTMLPVPHHQLASQAREMDTVFQDPLQKVHENADQPSGSGREGGVNHGGAPSRKTGIHPKGNCYHPSTVVDPR